MPSTEWADKLVEDMRNYVLRKYDVAQEELLSVLGGPIAWGGPVAARLQDHPARLPANTVERMIFIDSNGQPLGYVSVVRSALESETFDFDIVAELSRSGEHKT